MTWRSISTIRDPPEVVPTATKPDEVVPSAEGRDTAPANQGSPQRGPKEKMKESTSHDEAQRQAEGLRDAQSKERGNKRFDDGTPTKSGGNAIINSTKKSDDNLKNRLNRIKSKKDADDD